MTDDPDLQMMGGPFDGAMGGPPPPRILARTSLFYWQIENSKRYALYEFKDGRYWFRMLTTNEPAKVEV